jgi:AraC-like DNA-binding protein
MINETLHIKNMVCDRCIKSVTNILCSLSILHKPVKLGEVTLTSSLPPELKTSLKQKLEEDGFELIDDKKSKLIEQIKKQLASVLQNEIEGKKFKLSKFLGDSLHHDYSYLSNLFSSIEGRTIENYFINLKVEKIKELLVYDELSISEIAYRLGYSSSAHLSNQFKQVTGLTPSYFKSLGSAKRKPLSAI